MSKRKLISLFMLITILGTLASSVGASSHREAPLISQDPVADTTDVYMFVSPDSPDSVTLIQSVYPGQDAGSGPNFYRFGDDVAYSFWIDNDGDSRADIQYEFRFETKINNGDSFLYNFGPISLLADPNRNVEQCYTVTRIDYNDKGRVTHRTVLGTGLATPPSNIGPASTPNYNALMMQAVYDLGGTKVFAGQTDDAFFIDLGAIFDLVTIRPLDLGTGNVGNKGGGVDTLAGFNVQSIALQVPIDQVLGEHGDPVIGMWATSARRATIIRDDAHPFYRPRGRWVQVSRLGMPLVNEVVIPLKDKDLWNASRPQDDGQFLSYVTDPELARILNLLYFGPSGAVSALPDVQTTNRADLVTVFLTGVPGLNQPMNVVPSEQLRLNTSIKPDNAACTGSPLGVLAGDLCGFPNGRRLADDVTDIAERVVAGVLLGAPYDAFPYNSLGDGVDANDAPFQSQFPYLAAPHAGFTVGNHDKPFPLQP
jgi:hypothetical protein